MIISQIAVFARDFGLAHAPVWGVAALLALGVSWPLRRRHRTRSRRVSTPTPTAWWGGSD